MKIYIKIAMLLIISAYELTADEYSEQFFSLFSDYRLSSDQISYDLLGDNISCCHEKAEAIGTGFSINFDYKYRVYDLLYLGAFTGYQEWHSRAINDEYALISVNGEPYNGVFRHYLNSDFSTLNLFLYGEYFLYDKLSLMLGFGGYYYLNAEYDYIQKIVQPEDRGVFHETQMKSRNPRSGNFDSDLDFAAQIKLKYLLRLNKEETFFLAPQVSYSRNIRTSKYLKGKSEDITFGLGFVWVLGEKYSDSLSQEIDYSGNVPDVDITTTGITRDKEIYLDTVYIDNINSEKTSLNFSVDIVNFNIVRDAVGKINDWELIIYTADNTYTRTFTGIGELPSYVSWDLALDADFKELIEMFKMLSSSIPAKFKFNLKYQLFGAALNGRRIVLSEGELPFKTR